jgi:hypothetical protein
VHCIHEFPLNCSLQLFCMSQEMKRVEGFSTIADIPNFNSNALCQKVARVSGGAITIEQACLKQESESARKLLDFMIPKNTIEICREVAINVGGSYKALLTCVEQELAAAAKPQ